MKVIRNVSILSVAALILSSLTATGSFAAYYHGPSHGHHGGHHGPGYSDGVDAGVSAALGAVFLSLATSDSYRYEADTLIQAAALYEADGTATPIFESFVGSMSEEMTKQVGADEMSKVDSDTLYHMVAEQILNDAQ